MSYASPVDTSHSGVQHSLVRGTHRNEERVLIEVESFGAGTSVGQQPCPYGKSKMLIYRSELPAVLAKVRTPLAVERLRVAEQTFANILAEHIKQGGTEYNVSPSSPYELLAIDPAFKGGCGPLKSVTVLEEHVPPPPTTETLQQNQFDRLGATLERALAGAAGSMNADALKAFINEQVEAGVKAALAEKRKS